MSASIIIAEAGVNHNGDMDIAKRLIQAAADAGADYIKFQTFKAENLVNKSAQQADYQRANTGKTESQFDMLKRLELSYEDFDELEKFCESNNIKFLSTAFDLESIDYLRSKLDFYKIPSGEITNLPYLRKVAALKLPIVMSTGMATLKEVKDALDVIEKNGVSRKDICILHCNTEYPTPMQDVNLRAMNAMAQELNVDIGYSDHTLGIEVPIAAVALGAKVIEKHFTLDKQMPGPDHQASLEPHELKAMVAAIRNIERALGSNIKQPSSSERKNIAIARKSIVAKQAIKKGEEFTEQNITAKRPGDGISPMLWDEMLGTKAKKDYKPDELI